MHESAHDQTAAAAVTCEPRRRAATSAVLRARAVTALAASPAFRHASRRLVADLVERAALHRLGARRLQARVLLLVVLDGAVSVAPPVAAAARARDGMTLGPGVYWRDALVHEGRDRPIALAGEGGRARVLLLDEATLTRAVRASPALAAVSALRRRGSPTAVAEPRAHLVWMARAPGLALPLEPAARLLAAAVASQFAEPAGVVVAGPGGTRLAVCQRDGFRTVRLPAAAAQRDVVEALAVSAGRPSRPYQMHHLFYVHPGDPLHRPPPLAGQRFHRVVYLTDAAPARIPHRLDELLEPALLADDGSGALFSAFVPTVLLGRGTGAGFRVWSPHAERTGARGTRARRRLRRDLCRVALDARALAAEPWNELWRRHRGTAERWARAVTNRRVGVALSGGGACAYRTLPLLRALDAAGVPLDVVSGVSGGALMGAYLCTGGVAGLARAERRGARFLLAMLGAIAWSGCIERVLDHDLGGARVEDLEMLFAPVTTELGDPPRARVVSAGTVGEAVRASAAAPVLFGPTRKGGRRYADGAAATMLPAAVLTACGADLTLACTCVPPPTRGNPFARTLVGRLVYRWTPLGRLIDAWVATSMLLHSASRLAGRDAQVSWQPSGVRDPLGEALRFDRAAAIAADAEVRDRASIARTVAEVLARWRGLGV